MIQAAAVSTPKAVPFALHIRLTKTCNADCSYCSSWQETDDNRMLLEDYKKVLPWVMQTYSKMGIRPTHISVEYVGGEILTYPKNDLEAVVTFTRSYCKDNNIQLTDGVQTNLIGSQSRIDHLFDLFERRVGTSIDSYGSERTLNGSADKYRKYLDNSFDYIIKTRDISVPVVYVLTPQNQQYAMKELLQCELKKRNMTIRPVFNGGKQVLITEEESLKNSYIETFEKWFMRYSIILEPHLTLLKKIIQNHYQHDQKTNTDYCFFQSDCVRKSVSIEPNGDIFVCQDTADIPAAKGGSIFRLGNGIEQTFHHDVFKLLDERPSYIYKECRTCPHEQICNGGCMLHSYQKHLSITRKSPYCLVWKGLLNRMQGGVEEHGVEKVNQWIAKLTH